MGDSWIFYGIFVLFIALSHSQLNQNPNVDNNKEISQPNPIDLGGEPGTEKMKFSISSPALNFSAPDYLGNLPALHDRMGDLNLSPNERKSSQNEENSSQNGQGSIRSDLNLSKTDRMGEIGTGVAIKPQLSGHPEIIRKPGCKEEVMHGLEQRITNSKKLENIKFFIKEQELEAECIDMKVALNDLKKVYQECIIAENSDSIKGFYQGFEEIINSLCNPGAYRNQFLYESTCLNHTLSLAMNSSCIQKEPVPAELYKPGGNIPCQNFLQTFDCLKNAVSNKCNPSTVEFYECHVSKLLGDSFNVTCLASSITCKGKVINQVVTKNNNNGDPENTNISSTTFSSVIPQQGGSPQSKNQGNSVENIFSSSVICFMTYLIIFY